MTAYTLLLIFPILSATSHVRRSEFHDMYPYTAPLIKLRDGNLIPALAYGTGKADETEEEATSAYNIYRAIEVGFRHIDTAAADGVEKEIGSGIAQVIRLNMVDRADIFITSKLWSTDHQRSKVVPALKESLKKLNLTYVDLFLIQHPVSISSSGYADDIDYLDTWNGMIEAKSLGLTKSIGVSNFNEAQLSRIFKNSQLFPVVNQIEVNPTLTQIALVEFCQKLDIVVMAYSPFGFMYQPQNKNSREHKQKKPPPFPKEDDPILNDIARKHNKSIFQIVLRYLLDRNLIPVPRSSSTVHIEDNFKVLDFKLTKDEIKNINSFNRNKRKHPYAEWRNYPYYPFAINFTRRWQPIYDNETSIYIPKENLTRRWEHARSMEEDSEEENTSPF